MSIAYFNEVRNNFPSNVDDTFIEDFIESSELIEVKKNEILVAHKTIAVYVYFIVKGSFIKNVLTPENEEKTVMFHTASFFQSMVCSDSYVNGNKTDYIIVANEDSVILKVSKDYINKAFDKNVFFLKFHASYMEEAYKTMEIIRDKYISLTSEEYLLWLYDHYPFIFKLYQSKDIASFMGITPEWLSKLKRKVLS